MHIADVQLVRPGQHALGHRVAAGNHNIKAADIQLLDGQRHQRQIMAKVAPRQRQALDKAGVYRLALQEPTRRLWHKVHHGKYLGLRKGQQQLFQHPLGTGVVLQPVSNNGNARGRRRGGHGSSLVGLAEQPGKGLSRVCGSFGCPNGRWSLFVIDIKFFTLHKPGPTTSPTRWVFASHLLWAAPRCAPVAIRTPRQLTKKHNTLA